MATFDIDAMLADPVAYSMQQRQQKREREQLMQELTPEMEQSLLSQLGGGALSGLGYIGERFDQMTGSRALRGVLAGKPREALSFLPLPTDWLGITKREDITAGKELTGWDDPSSWWDDIAGFGVEVALDPTLPFMFGPKTALTVGGNLAKEGGALGRAASVAGRKLVSTEANLIDDALQAAAASGRTAGVDDILGVFPTKKKWSMKGPKDVPDMRAFTTKDIEDIVGAGRIDDQLLASKINKAELGEFVGKREANISVKLKELVEHDKQYGSGEFASYLDENIGKYAKGGLTKEAMLEEALGGNLGYGWPFAPKSSGALGRDPKFARQVDDIFKFVRHMPVVNGAAALFNMPGTGGFTRESSQRAYARSNEEFPKLAASFLKSINEMVAEIHSIGATDELSSKMLGRLVESNAPAKKMKEWVQAQPKDFQDWYGKQGKHIQDNITKVKGTLETVKLNMAEQGADVHLLEDQWAGYWPRIVSDLQDEMKKKGRDIQTATASELARVLHLKDVVGGRDAINDLTRNPDLYNSQSMREMVDKLKKINDDEGLFPEGWGYDRDKFAEDTKGWEKADIDKEREKLTNKAYEKLGQFIFDGSKEQRELGAYRYHPTVDARIHLVAAADALTGLKMARQMLAVETIKKVGAGTVEGHVRVTDVFKNMTGVNEKRMFYNLMQDLGVEDLPPFEYFDTTPPKPPTPPPKSGPPASPPPGGPTRPTGPSPMGPSTGHGPPPGSPPPPKSVPPATPYPGGSGSGYGPPPTAIDPPAWTSYGTNARRVRDQLIRSGRNADGTALSAADADAQMIPLMQAAKYVAKNSKKLGNDVNRADELFKNMVVEKGSAQFEDMIKKADNSNTDILPQELGNVVEYLDEGDKAQFRYINNLADVNSGDMTINDALMGAMASHDHPGSSFLSNLQRRIARLYLDDVGSPDISLENVWKTNDEWADQPPLPASLPDATLDRLAGMDIDNIQALENQGINKNAVAIGMNGRLPSHQRVSVENLKKAARQAAEDTAIERIMAEGGTNDSTLRELARNAYRKYGKEGDDARDALSDYLEERGTERVGKALYQSDDAFAKPDLPPPGDTRLDRYSEYLRSLRDRKLSKEMWEVAAVFSEAWRNGDIKQHDIDGLIVEMWNGATKENPLVVPIRDRGPEHLHSELWRATDETSKKLEGVPGEEEMYKLLSNARSGAINARYNAESGMTFPTSGDELGFMARSLALFNDGDIYPVQRAIEDFAERLLDEESELFQSGLKQRNKAAVLFDDAATIVALYKTADQSSFIHESSHIFRRWLSEYSDTDIMKHAEAELSKMLKEKGQVLTEGKGWTRDAEELWARQFEHYLRVGPGDIPPGLAKVFAQIKEWMVNIYRDITNSPLGKELNPELASMFDEIMGGKKYKRPVETTNAMEALREGQISREAFDSIGTQIDDLNDIELLEEIKWNWDEALKNTNKRGDAGKVTRNQTATEIAQEKAEDAKPARSKISQEAEKVEVPQLEVFIPRNIRDDLEGLGIQVKSPVSEQEVKMLARDPELAKVLGDGAPTGVKMKPYFEERSKRDGIDHIQRLVDIYGRPRSKIRPAHMVEYAKSLGLLDEVHRVVIPDEQSAESFAKLREYLSKDNLEKAKQFDKERGWTPAVAKELTEEEIQALTKESAGAKGSIGLADRLAGRKSKQGPDVLGQAGDEAGDLKGQIDEVRDGITKAADEIRLAGEATYWTQVKHDWSKNPSASTKEWSTDAKLGKIDGEQIYEVVLPGNKKVRLVKVKSEVPTKRNDGFTKTVEMWHKVVDGRAGPPVAPTRKDAIRSLMQSQREYAEEIVRKYQETRKGKHNILTPDQKDKALYEEALTKYRDSIEKLRSGEMKTASLAKIREKMLENEWDPDGFSNDDLRTLAREQGWSKWGDLVEPERPQSMIKKAPQVDPTTSPPDANVGLEMAERQGTHAPDDIASKTAPDDSDVPPMDELGEQGGGIVDDIAADGGGDAPPPKGPGDAMFGEDGRIKPEFDANNYWIPKEVAENINRANQGFTNPDSLNPVIKAIDSYTNLFKMGVLTRPSRYVRDFSSGVMQNFLAGQFSLWSTNDALKLAWGAKSIKSAKTIPIVQQMMKERGYDLADDVLATRVLREHLANMQIAGRRQARTAMIGKVAPMHPRGIDDIIEQHPGAGNTVPQQLKHDWDTGSWNPLNTRGVGDVAETHFFPAAVGDTAGVFTDSVVRIAPYMHMLKEGIDPGVARAKTFATQVDYSHKALTPFENAYMTRWVPFYKFQRGILPFVVQEAMSKPSGRLAQAMRAPGRMRGDEDFQPEHIANTLGIPIDIPGLRSSDPSSRRYLTGLGMMHEEIANLIRPGQTTAKGAEKTLGGLLGQLNPIVKFPVELAANRQFFSGRELQDLDSTVGRIWSNISGQDPPDTPVLLDQTLASSPLSSVAGNIRTATDNRKGMGAKALNLLTGIKVSDLDIEKSRAIGVREAMEDFLRGKPGVFSFENLYAPNMSTLDEADQAMVQMYKRNLASAQKRSRDLKKKEKKPKPIPIDDLLAF